MPGEQSQGKPVPAARPPLPWTPEKKQHLKQRRELNSEQRLAAPLPQGCGPPPLLSDLAQKPPPPNNVCAGGGEQC